MIKSKLDKIKDRISDPSFLANKGLSNEVGIHVFCYDPKDEIVVQDYIARLKSEANTPYRIIECDLYEIISADVVTRLCSSIIRRSQASGKIHFT